MYFRPNSTRSSLEMTAIGKTHPTLYEAMNLLLRPVPQR